MPNKPPKFEFSEKVKQGAYLASYFKKTVEVLNFFNVTNIVKMQWFQREQDVVLCGIEECLQLIKFACPNYQQLEIFALKDGDVVQPLEPVLKIEGLYQDFGWLEGMIDGILARNSSIATNVKRLVVAANGKQIIDMNDRSDYYLNQEVDGYASFIGGNTNFVTSAALTYVDPIAPPIGTMPHALIQNFSGDTLEATKAFHKCFPQSRLISLVDYNNDCVTEALRIADYFGNKLWGVRLDTSEKLVDQTLLNHQNDYSPNQQLTGVNEFLVRRLRDALDAKDHRYVKIIVSSGFNAAKIAAFERAQVPVDIYGVGSEISKVWINFTGDCVTLNGQPEAKVGRQEYSSERMERISFK